MPTAAQILPLLIAVSLTSGCSRYALEMFRENKLASQPVAVPRNHPEPRTWRDDRVTVSWLGHATVLINLYGEWLLTDPALHRHIGPPEAFDNRLGIRRILALPLQLAALPPIDLILVSHAHYDHLDLPSLQSLAASTGRIIVPRGVSALLKNIDVPQTELDWLPGTRQRYTTDEGTTISAFRVEHYGFVPATRRKTPTGFNGYLIEKRGIRIAFFGDTSFARNRDENGRPLPAPIAVDWSRKIDAADDPINLCILPIGDSHFSFNHIGPKEAVEIAEAMHCKSILPIHYGTFVLTPRRYQLDNPPLLLQKEIDRRKAHATVFCQEQNHDRLDAGAVCSIQSATHQAACSPSRIGVGQSDNLHRETVQRFIQGRSRLDK